MFVERHCIQKQGNEIKYNDVLINTGYLIIRGVSLDWKLQSSEKYWSYSFFEGG